MKKVFLWIMVVAVAGGAIAAIPFAANKSDDEKERAISINEVPVAVKVTIEQRLNGVPLMGLTTETEDGVVVYEAEFIVDGVRHEVEMKADGTIIEEEVGDDDADDADDD